MNGQLTLAEAMGLEPGLLRQISEIGWLALQMGSLENARIVFKGLVTASPHDSQFNCRLAATYVALERYDEALPHFDTSLQSDFRSVDALAGRGELFLRLGRRKEGVADLARAVAYDPWKSSPAAQRAAGMLSLLEHAASRVRKAPSLPT